jgi:hypothetical protein
MRHLEAIRVIDYIWGVLYLLGGAIFLVMFLLVSGLAGASNQEGSGAMAVIFGTFGLLLGGLFFLFGIVFFIAANALVGLRTWSRIFHVIMGVLKLIAFPLGTAYGVYVIWALLFSDETKLLFDSGPSGTSSELYKSEGSEFKY